MKLKNENNNIISIYLIVILLIEAKKVTKIPKGVIFPIPVKLRRYKNGKIL
jgi:hypothetical protein